MRARRKNRTFNLWQYAGIVFAGMMVAVGLYNMLFEDTHKTKSSEISPIQDVVQTDISTQTEAKKISPLEQIVIKGLEGTKGSYSIVIKNLKTGESYAQNEHKSYASASLYKLWIMGVVFQQIESGKIKLDDQLTADIEALNKDFDIASESAELKEGKLEFTINSALNQMITISHNYAALALTKKVGKQDYSRYLKTHKLTESEIKTSGPTTTAYDIAVFLEKLYKGELANQENTQKMITLLKAQKLNNKLPKDLPKNAVIAHKTGELDMVSHDAGIIYLEQGDYIVVVMSETTLPAAANERIAEISKGIYEYFRSKN